MDFVLRDFLLQSIDEDYEFNCRMITACYWPDSCTPIKSAFDLINKVKTCRLQSHHIQSSNGTTSTSDAVAAVAATAAASSNPAAATCILNSSLASLPPVIVHDLSGSYRAATFCALYTLQDLVHLEASVNVYEIAKMYHLRRPGVWLHKSNVMFLYEAVEYLFDEMHASNNYQFRNYLNLNIDNHFHNLLYSSGSQNYFNPTTQAQQPITSTNHVSLTLLPTSHQNKLHHIQQQQTLPNNLTTSNGGGSYNLPIIMQQQQQQQRSSLNEAIGSRLHNSSFQDSAAVMTTVPLTCAKISMDPTTATATTTNKTSFIDLPRSMLPSFFTTDPTPSTQARRSTSANYRTTSKAMKFMNTMRIKSVSFKRALFHGSSNMTTNSTTTTSSGSESCSNGSSSSGGSKPAMMSTVAISASQTIQMQPAGLVQQQQQISPNRVVVETNVIGHHHHLRGVNVDSDEQKPSIIISLSSGSSSATTSSSSTALSSTPITTVTTAKQISREKLN